MHPWTLLPSDPRYPKGIADLSSPPVLRVRGVLPQKAGVTIVGTRGSTPEGERAAFEMASALARANLAVWSGGALGIDGCAHRGALSSGGATVVVIGSGIARPTPREHLDLFEEVVLKGGAIVSRQEDDERAAAPSYHARNAVLAAATPMTIVVECPLRSGALSTVARARALGRQVVFIPHAPWMTEGAGCVLEIQRGAPLVTGAADVLVRLGLSTDVDANCPRTSELPRKASKTARISKRQAELFSKRGDVSEVGPPGNLSPVELRVYDALGEPLHLDQLCEKLAESVASLVPVVLGMVLSGSLSEHAPNVFRRA